MNQKFECKGCAKCCSRASLDVKHSHQNIKIVTSFPSFSKDGYTLFCHKPSLILFDWEAKELLKEAQKKGFKLNIVTYKVIYDLNKKRAIILQYTFLEKDCPFLSEGKKCVIYNKRPLLCRSFPVVNGGLKDLIQNKTHINISGCPNDLKEEDWKKLCTENPKKFDFIKTNYEIYGDCYLAKIESDKVLIDLENNIQKAITKNIIRPAKIGYNPEQLLQRIENSVNISISSFLEELNLRQNIEKIKELEWANNWLKEIKFKTL